MVDEATYNSIFRGALRLAQPRKGYRFTEDAVLLAAFAATVGEAVRAADFGAGCGVVGLSLLQQRKATKVILVELQERLLRFAAHNIELNELGACASTLRADLRVTPLADESVDLIVSNPPYMPVGTGHLPADRERSLARHELSCDPASLVSEAERCLVRGGRLCVVYPAKREAEIVAFFERGGLRPSRLRRILPFADHPSQLFMLEATKGGPRSELEIEKPLIARCENGDRPAECEAILSGEWSSSS